MAERKRRRLDNYELLELVKETKTGKVYKARDLETGQEMLLKVLKSSPREAPAGEPQYYAMPPQHSGPFPQAPYPPYQPQRTGPHPGSVIAVLLALVLAGMGGFKLGSYMTERELMENRSPTTAVPAQPQAPPADDTPIAKTGDESKPPEDKDAERERAAAEALAEARQEWTRLSERNDYEGGVLAFKTRVITPYAGTDPAREARAVTGRIYRNWGMDLATQQRYDEARQKLRAALEYLPEGSDYARSVRDRLPALTLQIAEEAGARRDTARALELYDEAARAARDEQVKAEVRLSRAELLRTQAEEHDRAYQELMELVRLFPETTAAATARKTAPAVLMQGARQALTEGNYEEARRLVQKLREDWPDAEETAQVADVEAQALYEQFNTAFAAREAVHNEYYRELLKRYPESDQALAAVRRRLGRREDVKPFEDEPIQKLMDMARERRAEGNYEGAIRALTTVVQSARIGSRPADLALRSYPEWLYEAVLQYHGTGLTAEAQRIAARIDQVFPHTRWHKLAESYRYGMAHTPQGMVFVPEGSFLMGTRRERALEILKTSPAFSEQDLADMDTDELLKMAGIPPETPRHDAVTGAYYIDATEVTNQEYKRFCDQTGHRTPMHWENDTYAIGRDAIPVSNVSLEDARAYAEWREARLPTEAEWEKAARGVDGRLFPWGNKWAPEKAHHIRRPDAGPVKVGSHKDGASPYGCLDMLGNVGEWTTGSYTAYEGSEFEPDPTTAGRSVLRGGAWWDPWAMKLPARCASRFPAEPGSLDRSVGFRCVVDVRPPPADDGVAQAE